MNLYLDKYFKISVQSTRRSADSSKYKSEAQKAVYSQKEHQRMIRFCKKWERRDEKLPNGVSVNRRKKRNESDLRKNPLTRQAKSLEEPF